jgi:arylsulfatase A-like enzyme
VETIDVLPTLLSLAGVKADPEIQGRPLPLGRSKARGLAFATTEMGHPGGHGLYLNQNSVQDEMWKLIYEPATGAARLYDLGSDPGEMRPLVSDPGEVVPRLLAALKQWMLETSALRVHTLGDVSDATRRKLEELGYVDVADPENKGKDPGAAEKRTPEDLTWDGETFTPPVLKEANGG